MFFQHLKTNAIFTPKNSVWWGNHRTSARVWHSTPRYSSNSYVMTAGARHSWRSPVLFLSCRRHCDWYSVPRHAGGIPHPDFGRKGSYIQVILARRHAAPCSHCNLALGGPKMYTEMDGHRQPYHMPTQSTRPYSMWFFLWGYIQDAIYVPPLPTTFNVLGE